MRILAFCYELSKKMDIQLFMCPEVEKTSSGCLSFFTDSYAAYGKFRCRWKFRPTGYAQHSWPWVVYAFNSQWPSVTTGHLFLLRVIYRNLWHSMKYSVAELLAVELISLAIGIPAPPFQYIYSVLTTSNTQHVQYKKVLFDPHRNLKSLKHNDWRVAVRPV